MRLVLVGVLFLVMTAGGRAADLTLACLDVGRAFEACQDSATRFSAETGHNVRVVAADATGRNALEQYRALFDVQTERIDVLQFPDAWVPALGADLATLPDPNADIALPQVLETGRDAGRLVGWPQHMAVMFIFLRSDVVEKDGVKAWSELRDGLIAAPADGAAGLAFGAAGPSLFPLFLDWLFSFGGESLADRDTLLRALEGMNEAIGIVATRGVTALRPREAINDFTGGNSAALFASSTALAKVQGSPVAEQVYTMVRPRWRGAPEDAKLLVTTWYVGVSRHSRQGEAAQQLVAFLTSHEAQRRAAIEFGLAPTRPALYDDPEVLGVSKAFRWIKDSLALMVPPPVGEYGVSYLELADEVADAVRGLLAGSSDPAGASEAIARAVRRANRPAR